MPKNTRRMKNELKLKTTAVSPHNTDQMPMDHDITRTGPKRSASDPPMNANAV